VSLVRTADFFLLPRSSVLRGTGPPVPIGDCRPASHTTRHHGARGGVIFFFVMKEVDVHVKAGGAPHVCITSV